MADNDFDDLGDELDADAGGETGASVLRLAARGDGDEDGVESPASLGSSSSSPVLGGRETRTDDAAAAAAADPATGATHARELLAARRELRKLQEERDKDLEEHLQVAELLEQTETELRREKAGHEAAHRALADAFLRLNAVTKERDDLLTRTETMKDTHAKDMTSLKEFHAREMDELYKHIDTLAAAHDQETQVLRARISSLIQELAGLAWTEKHATEAQVLGLEEAFTQILNARNSPTLQGLLTRFEELIAHPEADAWVKGSGWAERVCHAVEDARGAGVTTEVCAALSRFPKLVPGILRSAILSCLADVLELDPSISLILSSKTAPASVDTLPAESVLHPSLPSEPSSAVAFAAATDVSVPPRFRLSARDWTATRLNIASTFDRCLKVSSNEDDSLAQVSRFVAIPGVLAALAALTRAEARKRGVDGELLGVCTSALETVCSHAYHSDGIVSALFSSGAIAALNQVILSTTSPTQAVAVQALLLIPREVETANKLIGSGCVPSLIAVLRSARTRRLLPSQDSPASPILLSAVGLLNSLSQSASFAVPFLASDGMAVLVDLRPSDLKVELRQSLVEVLVNVVFQHSPALDAVAQLDMFGLIADVVEYAPAKSALLFRCLDVTASVLQAQPRLAHKITPLHIAKWAQLLETDFTAYNYKVAFVFFFYSISPQCSYVYLLTDKALGALAHLFSALHHEVQYWCVASAHAILSYALLIPSDSPHFPHTHGLEILYEAIWRMLAVARTPNLEARAALRLLQTTLLLAKISPSCDALTHALPRFSSLGATLATATETDTLLPLLVNIAETVEAHRFILQLEPLLKSLLDKETKEDNQKQLVGVVTSLWQREFQAALSVEGEAVIAPVNAELCSAGLGLLVKAGGLHPAGLQAAAMLLEIAYAHRTDGFLATMTTAGGVSVVARVMKEQDTMFRKGCVVISALLSHPETATRTLTDAGLGTLIDILRLSPDANVQLNVAKSLPAVFQSEEICTDTATSGLVSHVIALVETSPSTLEMTTGLRIMDNMSHYPKATVGLVKSGGLRVLADIVTMQQLSGVSGATMGMHAIDDDEFGLDGQDEEDEWGLEEEEEEGSEDEGEEEEEDMMDWSLGETKKGKRGGAAGSVGDEEDMLWVDSGDELDAFGEEGMGFARTKGKGKKTETKKEKQVSKSARRGGKKEAVAAGGGVGGASGVGGGRILAKEEQMVDAAPILARVLGYGAALAPALEYDNGVPVLVSLLEQIEHGELIELCIRLLHDLSTTAAGRDLLQHEALQMLVGWSQRSPNDDPDRSAEWVMRVRGHAVAALVNVAWNVQSARTREQQGVVLATLVLAGALPAYAEAIANGLHSDDDIEANPTLADKRELARRVLWAVATWLGHDPPHGRAAWVRAQGVMALLQVTDFNSTAEMRTFTRVILSKILCALGEDLTTRINLLKAQATVAKDPSVLWEGLAKSLEE